MTVAGRLISAVLLIACSASLAACGAAAHAGNGRDAAAAAAVSQTFLSVSKATTPLTASQAGCLGTGIIRGFGVDQSVRYGFLTQDLRPSPSLSLMLTGKDAATYADLYLRCADPSTTIKNALVSRIAPKTTAAEARLRACLDKTLTRTLMRGALAAAASGDSTNASLSPLYTACGKLG